MVENTEQLVEVLCAAHWNSERSAGGEWESLHDDLKELCRQDMRNALLAAQAEGAEMVSNDLLKKLKYAFVASGTLPPANPLRLSTEKPT